MSAHAKLSPSSAARWIACPGSVALAAGFEDVESEAAAEGTFAHDIAARCLTSGLDAANYIGETDGRFTCDADMAGHLQSYLDVVRDYVEPGVVPGVEQKVSILDDLWGTADAYTLSADGARLDVFDLKYGAGVHVAVRDNPQLGVYALGVLLTHALDCLDVEQVTIHVVQPRHYQGGHTSQTVKASTLREWGNRDLVPAADATRVPDAALASGDHCRFCPAKPGCPELRSTALAATAHLFDDLDGDAATLPAKITPAAPADMDVLSPAQIASALSMIPTVEQWIKAIHEHAYGVAARGGSIPGYKLVDKTSNRKWRDESDVELVLDVYGVDPYAKPKLLSPAQAEKKLTKADRSAIDLLAHKPKTGTALVPTADKRPAVTPGDVFADLC